MPRKRTPPLELFWSHVEKTDGCWLWRGTLRGDGYGIAWVAERLVRAHVFSWEQENGPVPEGLCVLHSCDVRSCVRPDHLWLGTRRENQRDMALKGRAPLRRLSDDEVRAIRRDYRPRTRNDPGNRAELALRYGVQGQTINGIVRGLIDRYVR